MYSVHFREYSTLVCVQVRVCNNGMCWSARHITGSIIMMQQRESLIGSTHIINTNMYLRLYEIVCVFKKCSRGNGITGRVRGGGEGLSACTYVYPKTDVYRCTIWIRLCFHIIRICMYCTCMLHTYVFLHRIAIHMECEYQGKTKEMQRIVLLPFSLSFGLLVRGQYSQYAAFICIYSRQSYSRRRSNSWKKGCWIASECIRWCTYTQTVVQTLTTCYIHASVDVIWMWRADHMQKDLHFQHIKKYVLEVLYVLQMNLCRNWITN